MTEWKGPGPWVRINESDVIDALRGGEWATYVVANKLRRHKRYRHIKTSAVLSRLKRMETGGMVKRVTGRRNPYSRQLKWELADVTHTAPRA